MIHIATNYGSGRFYNAQRTKKLREQGEMSVSKVKAKKVSTGGSK